MEDRKQKLIEERAELDAKIGRLVEFAKAMENSHA